MESKTFYIGKYGIQDANDCSVVALADYFGISYTETKLIMSKNGRGNAQEGASLVGIISAIWDISGRKPRMHKPKEKLLVHEAKKFDSCFIFTKDHVMQYPAFSISNCEGHENAEVELIVHV
ncbi:hypothetical protein 2AV2_154 [Nodularia phage vB_NpeS-2AV2]|jgi:hypothetical protein|uniref:Uncharacterized protein n=2 Tax=Ravarandavirus TaxID=2843444 RepID=A0A482MLQ3_9CAUD|nr:hypothetical protein HWA92_gp154 [Nodularia phage vB_NpeS-2AV2]ALY07606.1 hypothetical protein 2AV2_154 [Nodularia phage vB_NpeS-2AV2]QBQ74013.1 hypothetical protein kac68v162_gp165 [Nodularia phage vB_NspS-kac68v162]